jgi:hypothetical protein
MRKYRTKEEWTALIQEQEKSGKKVAAFCHERNIHPNLFYKKRKENNSGRFVRLPLPVSVAGSLKIKIKDVIIEPGSHISADDLKGILQVVMEVVDARV